VKFKLTGSIFSIAGKNCPQRSQQNVAFRNIRSASRILIMCASMLLIPLATELCNYD
jgi:hypothetical protein